MYMEESIRTLLAGTTALLAGHVDNPRLEAEILLAHILGKERLFLRLHDRDHVEGAKASLLQDLAGRRLLGEPLAYLTGKREFFGREFCVARGVLIPRPETELMVETALELAGERKSLLIADLGAGTGCIGISLALERLGVAGYLLEKSPLAISVCRKNRDRLGAQSLVVLEADMKNVPLPDASLDMVLANPPYIAKDDPAVEEGVRRYEPGSALFADNAGLELLEACVCEARRLLKKGGWVLLEHGLAQGEAVRHMLAKKHFCEFFTKKDLAGLDRLSIARV